MSNGKLEVTEEILDRVVYGMENQKDQLFLDPEDGQLKEKSGDRRAMIPMPEWGSTEGFRLMDSFVATLPDIAFRRNLSDILHSGSGVFRRFKDALKERSGTEGLWRRHKQKEMRKAALSWLSRWSDALELEHLGPEPEEWDELSLSEFSFREAGEDDVAFLEASGHAASMELHSGNPGGFGLSLPDPDAALPEGVGGWIAEAPGDVPVGCILMLPSEKSESGSILCYIYVVPEFRGLGIGRKLTESSLDGMAPGGPVRFLTGPVGAASQKWMESLGFTQAAVLWQRPKK